MKRLVTVLFAVLLLTACAKKQETASQVKISLPPAERAKIETQIAGLEREIQDYHPAKEGDAIYAPVYLFIDLARGYESLGNYPQAIRIYQKALSLHKQAQAVVHNMGRLYEDMGDYPKAVEQYTILIKDYAQTNYWYDVTWAQIRAGKRKEAEKAFNQWQNAFRKTDLQTQTAIKKMK
ncbi:tetratricopeptide repeat protein [Candidatus Peregrinibacteria bacterium]|nr:tetratricopeptide repeat protein [Candidatus Peregrinibacteria bacterium]